MKKLIILVLITSSSFVCAESIFLNAVERYENRKNAQWLLIQPERKFGLFEQWLAFNAAEKLRAYPFEFFVGYDYGGITRDNDYWPSLDINDSVYSFYGRVYYSIFGFGFKREKARDTYKQWEVIADFRLLGFNTQTTNLVFQLGNRWINDEILNDSFSNFFIGIDTQLYIFRFFGLQFNWRSYFGDEGDSTGQSLRSTRLSLALFFEIDFMRFYFNWYTETSNLDVGRNAGQFGVRFYY